MVARRNFRLYALLILRRRINHHTEWAHIFFCNYVAAFFLVNFQVVQKQTHTERHTRTKYTYESSDMRTVTMHTEADYVSSVLYINAQRATYTDVERERERERLNSEKLLCVSETVWARSFPQKYRDKSVVLFLGVKQR